MEPDRLSTVNKLGSRAFQSTGSVWSPTGFGVKSMIVWNISIHGLRVEPDALIAAGVSGFNKFQSTGSVWSPTAPAMDRAERRVPFQSTGSVWSPTVGYFRSQSPRTFQSTGSVWSPTFRLFALFQRRLNFNPRAPCGARHQQQCVVALCEGISIHGLRVEPDVDGHEIDAFYMGISIHGLRVEPDKSLAKTLLEEKNFNPRAPCGARRVLVVLHL